MAVEIFGLRQFTTNLKRLGAEAQDLKDVFRQIAAEVAEDAKRHAPERTGKMKGKIRGSRHAQNRARITVTGTRYHRFQHFGGPYTVPNPVPFMFKAMDDNVDSIDGRLLQGINDLIERTF